MSLKPDFDQAWLNLGNVSQRQAKLDRAEACYRRALALKPDLPEAENNLGIVLKDQGRIDEAEAAYRRSLATRPRLRPGREQRWRLSSTTART